MVVSSVTADGEGRPLDGRRYLHDNSSSEVPDEIGRPENLCFVSNHLDQENIRVREAAEAVQQGFEYGTLSLGS